MNTISNVWNGRAGLAKTYWLWGVLSGIPWALALSLVAPSSHLAIVLVLAFVTYYVVVHVGVWRAASQYQGAKIWATLAKVAAAITPACLVIGALAAIIIPAMHQPSKQEHPATPTTQPLATNNEPTKVEAASSSQPIFHSEKEVISWGDDQISKNLTKEEIEMAHRYARLWQARLIYDLNHDSIESLYIGYNIINHNLLVNGLCRPQYGPSGDIGRSANGNIRFGTMDCYRIEYLK